MDHSLPGSSVHGILQAWTLEWVVIPFSRRSSQARDPCVSYVSCTGRQNLYHQHHLQRRHWHPTPVLLPGKSHGRRSLVGCSPWGRWESDTTEQLHFHFSLSCIGEGNGNPLQCSCLENPGDGGAWWAAIYGVTQSRTRLKWLSSSSSSVNKVGSFSFAPAWLSADHMGCWPKQVMLACITPYFSRYINGY